jgi:cobalt-zinc-cadmium efflux system outer membrane protein
MVSSGEVMAKMVYRIKLIMCLVVATFIAGCVSAGEKHALTELAQVEKTRYVLTESDSSTPLTLPQLTDDATLSDYLAYAALNNPGLEAAFNRWKAALEKVPQARALDDPRFTYGYYIKEVETRAGPQRHKFELSQMFPWFGKLDARGDIALEAAHTARQRYESEKLKLFFEVKDAYYEYYYLSRAIAITEEHKRLITYLESIARTNYSAGITSYGDLMKTQVELGRFEDRVLTLRDFRNPLTAKLNQALNRPFNHTLPYPQAIPQESAAFTDDQLIASLRESNPELKAIDSTIAQEKASIDLAKKNYFPDLTLGVEYINTNPALEPPANPETGEVPRVKDDGKDPVIAKFAINLPIWFNKYSAGEKEARLRHVAALSERRDRENSLIVDLKMELYNFRDAERKIDLYRDTLVPKAKQTFTVIQKAFTGGKTDFLDVVDAERTLLEFELSYERALSDRAQRLAKLEELIGQEIPGDESSSSGMESEQAE